MVVKEIPDFSQNLTTSDRFVSPCRNMRLFIFLVDNTMRIYGSMYNYLIVLNTALDLVPFTRDGV